MVQTLLTEYDLEKWFITNEYEIAKTVTDTILANTRTPTELTLYSFEIFETLQKYDVTVLPEDYKETLEVYLEVLEDYEDYERCAYAKNAINSL